MNQTCTEVVLWRFRATGLELGDALAHWEVANPGVSNPGCGSQSPTEGQIWDPESGEEGKSGQRIWNSEKQSSASIMYRTLKRKKEKEKMKKSKNKKNEKCKDKNKEKN